MKNTMIGFLGLIGAVLVLFAFLPGRKQARSRLTEIRPAEPCWFCYPDAN